jgi:hypothetical protein
LALEDGELGERSGHRLTLDQLVLDPAAGAATRSSRPRLTPDR